eukprot:CAMPEP_0172746282 /NCGR_PEP_ID=MMETSP1074-20121228/140120_1 /TAXON_ID=2916 /ORGANISM="Ceratium fusus, Strain PA161109" /LENGTH=363 /DNA_ID=CAMNT_0013577605 /DNA_START=628 /DNA_END=1719 /DNA_ORIENTATION=-
MNEITYTVVFIVVALIADCIEYSYAQAMLNAQTSEQSEAVVHRLLSSMCDAVVHLDADLIIQQRSHQLETLLLRPGSMNGLLGLPFQDCLFGDSEKDNFSHRLLGDAGSLACSMSSRMRDSFGNAIPVHFFYSSFHDLVTDRFGFIIGIREDVLEERLAPMTFGNRFSNRDVEADVLPLPVVATGMDGSDDSRNAEAETGIDGSSALSSEQNAFATAIWIDVSSPRLKVTRCSTNFKTLCGPSGRCPEFEGWILKRQLPLFNTWLQQTVNSTINGDDPPEPFGGLVLRPPHLMKHKVWIKTEIRAVVDTTFIEAAARSDEHESVIKLELRNVTWHQGRIWLHRADSGARPQPQRPGQRAIQRL